MNQFLGFISFFLIIGSLVLHSGTELPWYLQWVGTLPGDIIIKKKGIVLYAPLTSSVLVSSALSLISSFFSSNTR